MDIVESKKYAEEDEEFLLEKIKDVKEGFCWISVLCWVNMRYFLYSFFEEHEVQKSKIFLYKIGMIAAYEHEKLDCEIFKFINTFAFPILSDCSKLIERFTGYLKTGRNDSFTAHFAQGIQSILKNDMPALKKHIDGLMRCRKTKEAKLYAGIVTSYEGFYNNDKEQISSGIFELLKNTKKQRPNSLDYQHIHYEATAIAKLAWRRGMEIEIDSPLAPKALLPVRELEHYEGYDFFRELENE